MWLVCKQINDTNYRGEGLAQAVKRKKWHIIDNHHNYVENIFGGIYFFLIIEYTPDKLPIRVHHEKRGLAPTNFKNVNKNNENKTENY